MQQELNYLYNISHSKWGIRGMVNVFNNAVNNEDISWEASEDGQYHGDLIFIKIIRRLNGNEVHEWKSKDAGGKGSYWEQVQWE